MELSYTGGAEAESLLRPDQRAAIMPGTRVSGLEGGDGERAPFIRNEPVKLTPAWEGSNLPNDTLNLKGVAMDLAPPKDKWNLIYWTMMLHGLGTLTAWNMFITAKQYFVEYKLKDSEYRGSFLVYIGYASQIPNFIFSWLNVFIEIRGELSTRIMWSIIMEVIIFVLTVVMAMEDTSNSKAMFFWFTMVSIFFLNAFNAVFQNSVYGVAARLPPKYTGVVVLGNNLAGCTVVLISWVSDTVGGSLRTAAIYYFIFGIFVLLLCFDTYIALPLNRFFRYHTSLQERAMNVNPALAANQKEARTKPKTPYGAICRQIWPQIINVFLVFFVTLAVFPAIHADVQSVTGEFLGKRFMLLTCFLTFNVMATLGNITASWIQFPTRRWLFILTTIRLLFLPLYLLSNYRPQDVTRTLTVWIDNDILYWLIAVLFGWSHGHASSLAMMYVSGDVAPEHQAKAGMLGAATLITGILAGISFSGFGAMIVSSDVWKTS